MFITVGGRDRLVLKYDLLEALLSRTNYDSVIIFCSTKLMADKVAHKLKAEKHAVAVLHADRTQRERMEALEQELLNRYYRPQVPKS